MDGIHADSNSTNAATLASRARRIAGVRVLRTHPQLTLKQLAKLVDQHPDVGQITVGELATRMSPPRPMRSCSATEYADRMLDLLRREARPLSSGEIRAEVGGRRWDVQAAARRLVEHGLIHRVGETSGTRYFVQPA